MRDDWRQVLRETRAYRPEQIEEMALARRRRQLLGNSGRLLIVAADHPARGAMSIGDDKQPARVPEQLASAAC